MNCPTHFNGIPFISNQMFGELVHFGSEAVIVTEHNVHDLAMA